MGRARTASNILDAKGAFKKDPQRKRINEPTVTDPFPKTPPAVLTAKEKKCWKEIVKAAPAGVLTAADVLIVEVIAVLLSEFRTDREYFTAARLTRLTTEMGKIGLSPSARASLSVEKPKGNEFDDV